MMIHPIRSCKSNVLGPWETWCPTLWSLRKSWWHKACWKPLSLSCDHRYETVWILSASDFLTHTLICTCMFFVQTHTCMHTHGKCNVLSCCDGCNFAGTHLTLSSLVVQTMVVGYWFPTPVLWHRSSPPSPQPCGWSCISHDETLQRCVMP
mgnify:CR=1 FL=1